MRAEHVAELYQELDKFGVAIWIDGGWAVDAVVGRQKQSHNDPDIAVEAKSLPKLRQFLAQRGYGDVATCDETAWSSVPVDAQGRVVDVHAGVLDAREGVWTDTLDGIAYPAGSLAGEGVIAGACLV